MKAIDNSNPNNGFYENIFGAMALNKKLQIRTALNNF